MRADGRDANAMNGVVEETLRRWERLDMLITAHSVGDGAVRTLLDTYEQLDRELAPGALRATVWAACY